MSTHRINRTGEGPRAHWLNLGDMAIATDRISAVHVNDGADLADRSLMLSLTMEDGHTRRFDFRTADQLNEVLEELGLGYTPTTPTIIPPEA